MKTPSVFIIGAGPAGLSSAYELAQNGIRPTVLESSDRVGGLAGTEIFDNYYFDIGGHRFFTKNERINRLWKEMMGDDFLSVKRLSRIYYNNRYFDYPIRLTNTICNLGARESALIILSRLLAAFKPNRDESTYEQWIINRFGKRMYRLFFKSYTEKVWGIPCTEIHSAWAAQRIQNLSLLTAATGALFGSAKAKSLIDRFNYPSQGPGMMWRRFADSIKQQGGEIIYKAEVFRIEHERRHIKNIVFRINGEEITQPADMVLSSAPITDLIDMLLPKAPESVLRARLRLKHRAFVIVLLVVDHADLFPDQWIYIHSPKVNVCRIQNFKNWSTSMIPDLNTTSLGMEYFCDEGDALWCMSDKDLCDLAAFELEQIGLARKCRNLTGRVIRQSKAYPVYHMGYEDDLKLVKEYLSGFDNLLIMGRNGTHRYNNMDHSMETGYLAARAVLGEYYDTWNVNDEARYLE